MAIKNMSFSSFLPKTPQEWFFLFTETLKRRRIFITFTPSLGKNPQGQTTDWVKEVCLEALGWNKTQWFLKAQEKLWKKDQDIFTALYHQFLSLNIKDPLWNAPIGRFLGFRYFMERPYFLNTCTLDPRFETQELVSLVYEHFTHYNINPKSILDLGTGSGCILLSLLRLFPQCLGVGLDSSSGALAMAKYNASYHEKWFIPHGPSIFKDFASPSSSPHISNEHPSFLYSSPMSQHPQYPTPHNGRYYPSLSSRIFWQKSYWFRGLPKTKYHKYRFSCIVSNPPYIDYYLDSNKDMHMATEKETPLIGPEVLRWDPKTALFGGLDPYREILKNAQHFLEPRGLLAVEIGWNQKDAVFQLFENHGFQNVVAYKDSNNFWRFILGIK